MDYFTSTWDLLLFICCYCIVLVPDCLVDSSSTIRTENLVSVIIHRVKISALLLSAVPDAIQIQSERRQSFFRCDTIWWQGGDIQPHRHEYSKL